MPDIKFDTIKKNAKEIFNNIADRESCFALLVSIDNKQSWWTNLKEMKEAGYQLIDRWDVRQVRKLIELFPGAVPKTYRTKSITVYMADNENCDWMVSFS